MSRLTLKRAEFSSADPANNILNSDTSFSSINKFCNFEKKLVMISSLYRLRPKTMRASIHQIPKRPFPSQYTNTLHVWKSQFVLPFPVSYWGLETINIRGKSRISCSCICFVVLHSFFSCYSGKTWGFGGVMIQ